MRPSITIRIVARRRAVRGAFGVCSAAVDFGEGPYSDDRGEDEGVEPDNPVHERASMQYVCFDKALTIPPLCKSDGIASLCIYA